MQRYDCFFFVWFLVEKDEDKGLLKMNLWKKLVRYIKRLNAYHELVADGEATFSNANANGNPEEQ